MNSVTAWIIGIVIIFAGGALSDHMILDAHWQHKWDQHVAQDKKAIDAAVAKAHEDERQAAKLSDTSTAKQVEVQTKIVNHTITLMKEVPHYVTVVQDAMGCVTFGMQRVFNAAATGTDPAAYQLPPGQSDDQCTATPPSALAAAIAENFGTARANAEQLNGLIEDVKSRINIANGGTP